MGELVGRILVYSFAAVLYVIAVPIMIVVWPIAWPFLRGARAWSAIHGHPLNWLRVKLGRGRGIRHLARELQIPEIDLQHFEPGYRTTRIPKRSGGTRLLHVPNDETKRLQKQILRRVLARLPAHPAAAGFERGSSIVHNARRHVGQAVVIKMDIVDFFPSTKDYKVRSYYQRVGYSRSAAALLQKLTTVDGGLPQGAPTSPRLSNLVNRGLDERIQRIVARRRGTYTRYADDITISFPKDFPRCMRGVRRALKVPCRESGYRLHKRKKLGIFRQHQQQLVTGLVVNQKVQLPRKTRRWLRAVIHNRRQGRDVTLSDHQILGWLALQQMIQDQRSG